MALLLGLAQGPAAHAQDGPLPSCTGWSNCNPGRVICAFESAPPFYGSTIVADLAGGLSSDGLGPYRPGTDGVGRSWVAGGFMSLSLNGPTGPGGRRTLSLDLSDPVAGGGGVPLGTVTVSGDNFLYTSWQRVGTLIRSLVSIPIGATVTAGQINVSFHLEGRFHVLQMGPQPLGHCHESGGTRVHGGGTTTGTIHRAGPSRWVVDLPPGSVGRLFDASHTVRHAVDKGLYRIGLHYELVNAVLGAGAVLRPLAEAGGGAAVVAHYRLLKRDSADAYFFSAQELLPSGFHLLDTGRPDEALLVFRLSDDEYPENTGALGGLGEAYVGVGDTVRAVSALRRAVALDPANRRAGELLRRLGVTP